MITRRSLLVRAVAAAVAPALPAAAPAYHRGGFLSGPVETLLLPGNEEYRLPVAAYVAVIADSIAALPVEIYTRSGQNHRCAATLALPVDNRYIPRHVRARNP